LGLIAGLISQAAFASALSGGSVQASLYEQVLSADLEHVGSPAIDLLYHVAVECNFRLVTITAPLPAHMKRSWNQLNFPLPS